MSVSVITIQIQSHDDELIGECGDHHDNKTNRNNQVKTEHKRRKDRRICRINNKSYIAHTRGGHARQ